MDCWFKLGEQAVVKKAPSSLGRHPSLLEAGTFSSMLWQESKGFSISLFNSEEGLHICS